ncbi:MAG: hypothetical protein RBR75_00655 [Acholeplasmataceae bacterium]|jgi:hypothetical protein|nr:hypothetical protein [Acholeplasmataceae bacterium]
MQPIEIIRIVLIAIIIVSAIYLLFIYYYREKHEMKTYEDLLKTNDYVLYDTIAKIEDKKLKKALLVLSTYYQSIARMLEDEKDVQMIDEIQRLLKQLNEGHVPHATYYRALHAYVFIPYPKRFHVEQLLELIASYQDKRLIEDYKLDQYLFAMFIRKHGYFTLLAQPLLHEVVLTLSYAVETTKLLNHIIDKKINDQSILMLDLVTHSSKESLEPKLLHYLYDKATHYFDRIHNELYRFGKDVEIALKHYVMHYRDELKTYKNMIEETTKEQAINE